jgi:hypothetical protein
MRAAFRGSRRSIAAFGERAKCRAGVTAAAGSIVSPRFGNARQRDLNLAKEQGGSIKVGEVAEKDPRRARKSLD